MGYSYADSSPVDSIAVAVVAVALGGRSPLDHLPQVVNRVIRVIRRSSIELARSDGDRLLWLLIHRFRVKSIRFTEVDPIK